MATAGGLLKEKGEQEEGTSFIMQVHIRSNVGTMAQHKLAGTHSA